MKEPSATVLSIPSARSKTDSVHDGEKKEKGKKLKKVKAFMAARESLIEKERVFSEEIVDLKRNLRETQRKVELKNSFIKKLKVELKHITEQAAKHKTELQERCGDFEAEKETLMAEFEKKLSQACEEVKETKQQKYASDEKKRYFQKALRQAKTELGGKETLIEKEREKNASLVERNQALVTEAITLTNSVKQSKQLKTKLGTLTQNAGKLDHMVEEAKKERDRLKRTILERTDQIEDLKTQSIGMTTEFAELQAQLQRQRTETDGKAAENARLYKEVAASNSLIAQLNARMEEQENVRQLLTEQFESQIESEKERGAELVNTIKVLRTKLASPQSPTPRCTDHNGDNNPLTKKLVNIENALQARGISINFLLKGSLTPRRNTGNACAKKQLASEAQRFSSFKLRTTSDADHVAPLRSPSSSGVPRKMLIEQKEVEVFEITKPICESDVSEKDCKLPSISQSMEKEAPFLLQKVSNVSLITVDQEEHVTGLANAKENSPSKANSPPTDQHSHGAAKAESKDSFLGNVKSRKLKQNSHGPPSVGSGGLDRKALRERRLLVLQASQKDSDEAKDLPAKQARAKTLVPSPLKPIKSVSKTIKAAGPPKETNERMNRAKAIYLQNIQPMKTRKTRTLGGIPASRAMKGKAKSKLDLGANPEDFITDRETGINKLLYGKSDSTC